MASKKPKPHLVLTCTALLSGYVLAGVPTALAAPLSMQQVLLNYRTDLYQTNINLQSYVGKWQTDCHFDNEQQDYVIDYYEFNNPFKLKHSKQVFHNHICTIPRLRISTEHSIKHIGKQDSSIILYLEPTQKMMVTPALEHNNRLELQQANHSIQLTRAYQ